MQCSSGSESFPITHDSLAADHMTASCMHSPTMDIRCTSAYPYVVLGCLGGKVALPPLSTGRCRLSSKGHSILGVAPLPSHEYDA